MSTTNNNGSSDSVDAREEPLHTPSKDQSHGTTGNDLPKTPSKEQSTVTIFDVATEIETMLSEINKEIKENSEQVDSFVTKINTRLDEIESKVRFGS